MRFKVLTSSQMISITFQYGHYDKKHCFNGPIVRHTSCTIREVQPEHPTEDGILLATAESIQQDGDGDCKFTARRMAMRKALKQCNFTKEQRRGIWNDYLEKVKIPKIKYTIISTDFTNMPIGKPHGDYPAGEYL